MMNMQLPSWAYWAMGAGLACFIALVALSVRRHHGVKRSLFAAPYTLWMLVFTLLPCILIAYYAFTDTNGAFTLDNFRSFWDSNNSMRENLRALAGDEVAATVARGSVNVDTLVYSLWMAFLCTAISLLLGMVYNFLPFMVFPIYTSLSKLDPKLGEAAQDLGCNEFRTLLRVTMPLSIPGVISGITMVFMPSVTTFFIPRVLGGGNTQMFGDLIESTFLVAGNWNLGSALSLIMMILILISLSILRKADPNGEGGGIV